MRRPLVLATLVIALVAAGCAEQPPDGDDVPNNQTGTTTPAGSTTPTGGTTPTSPTATPPPLAVEACLPEPRTPDETWGAEKPRVRLETTLGDIVIELEMERAPITAGNFLRLTQDGFYDGVTFHRVSSGFVIQGGDPNSKDDNPSNDGQGGPGYDIPDEFNPTLRHDAAGVLSMATAGPDTGGSQFFITLAATPSLDDRHSVFGRVVEGMDVVNDISRAPADENERPVEDVTIVNADVVEPATFDAVHATGVHAVIAQKPATPGDPVTFAVVLKNEGNTRDAVALAAAVPAGWSCQIRYVDDVIPAGTARVAFLTLTPTADAPEGPAEIDLESRSAWEGAASGSDGIVVDVRASLGPQVQSGDNVRANYVGFLPDGRLFDTSMQRVATDPDMPKFATHGGFRPRADGEYNTFDFEVGGPGVIGGFSQLALTARAGEIVTSYIESQHAYPRGDMYQRPLTGRDLVFELEILEIL